MEKDKLFETPDKIHYQERLKELYNLYYEAKIEKSLVSENVKDAIHDAFLKLYQTEHRKIINIITDSTFYFVVKSG